MAILRTIVERCYGNFVMPSRLAEYAGLLASFQQCDFEPLTLGCFAQRQQHGQIDTQGRYLLLRSDVDTDVSTTRAMWSIEQRHGMPATRFFRLSTLDVSWMREIDQAGGEVGYHYEEVATFAKRHGLRDPHEVRRRLSEIQDLFRANLYRLRTATGLGLSTVAAHGDFANRRLGIANTEILADQDFRKRVGVSLEAYDNVIEGHLSARHCDRPYPQWWAAKRPEASASRHPAVVLILLHPRHWRVNIWCNAKEDLRRLWEGVRFAWRPKRTPRTI